MNEDVIKQICEMNLPDEVKEDTIACVKKVMMYNNENTKESLLDWKNAYALAFTTLKTYKASHEISPTCYDTLLDMIRL